MKEINMNKILTIIIALVLILQGGWIIKESVKEQPMGGVVIGGEYTNSTNTQAMEGGAAWATQEHRIIASTTPFNMVSSTLQTDQRFGAITLGSVIISSSSVGTLIIHDATSTSDKASTTVAWFDNDNNASPGTYVFDIALKRGLMLDFSAGYHGAATITWR